MSAGTIARAKIPSALVLAFALVLAGCGGPAADPAGDATPATGEVGELTRMLVAGGLDAVVFDGESLLLKRGWLQVLVFVEDGGESLQAVFPHTGIPAEADPARVAGWNATRRFGRAYLDDDGRPVLASDLLLGAGVGEAAVLRWARLVLDMAAFFASEVWPVPVPLADPAAG